MKLSKCKEKRIDIQVNCLISESLPFYPLFWWLFSCQVPFANFYSQFQLLPGSPAPTGVIEERSQRGVRGVLLPHSREVRSQASPCRLESVRYTSICTGKEGTFSSTVMMRMRCGAFFQVCCTSAHPEPGRETVLPYIVLYRRSHRPSNTGQPWRRFLPGGPCCKRRPRSLLCSQQLKGGEELREGEVVCPYIDFNTSNKLKQSFQREKEYIKATPARKGQGREVA